MSYLISLSKFEGPLALLLHLIRQEEMNIFDINIHEITRQYLEHIRLMRELDLEVAGDFIAMAATLIQIKSKMLLPQGATGGVGADGQDSESGQDPRQELVQKLLEYQKYQAASQLLQQRPWLGRDVWVSGGPETRAFGESTLKTYPYASHAQPDATADAAAESALSAVSAEMGSEGEGAIAEETRAQQPEVEIEIEGNPLFALIGTYRKALRKMKKTVHQVRARVQSIASRVFEIKDFLVVGERQTLRELLCRSRGISFAPSETQSEEVSVQSSPSVEPGIFRIELLITFLSLLELARMGFVSLFQSDVYEDIHIDTRKKVVENLLDRIEEFEHVEKTDILAETKTENENENENGSEAARDAEQGQLTLADDIFERGAVHG